MNALWEDLIVRTKDPSELERIEAYRKFITIFLSEIQAEEKRLKLKIQVNQNPVNDYYRELYSDKKAMYLQLERILKVFLSAQDDEKNVRFQNLITLQRIPNHLFIEDHFPILEQIIDGAMENAETSLGRQDQLRILIMNFIRYGNKDFPNLYSFGIKILNKYSHFLYQHPNFWEGYPFSHQENYDFVKDKIYTKIRECIVDNQIKDSTKFEKFIFLISDYWERDTQIKDWLEKYIFTSSELRSGRFIERWITHGIQPYLNRQARRTKEIERIQRLLDYNKKYIRVPLIYQWVFSFQTQFVDDYLQSEDKETIIEIINSHPRYIKFLSHAQKNIIFNWLLEKRGTFDDVADIEEIQQYTKLILKYPLQSQVLIEKWNPNNSQDITSFNLNLSSLAVIDCFNPNIISICLDKLKSLDPAYFPTALNVLLKICNRVPSIQRDRLLECLIPSLMNIPLEYQPLKFESLNIVREYMPKSIAQTNQNDVDQDLENIIENYRLMKNLGNAMDKYELKLDLSNQTEANTLIINEHGLSFLNKCESALTYGYMNQLLDFQYPKKYITNPLFQKGYIVPFFPRFNAYVKKLIEKSLDRKERIKTTPDGKKLSESYSNMYTPIDIGFYYLLPKFKDLFLPHILCEDKDVLNWVYEHSVRGWFIDHKEDVYNQLVSAIMNPTIEFKLRMIYFHHLLGFAYSEQYSERVYLKILRLIEMEKERLKSNTATSQELFPKTSEFRELIEMIFQYYTNYNLKFNSYQKIGTIFKIIKQDELLRSQFDLHFRFTYSLIAERSIENLDAFVKDTLENHPDYPYFDFYLIKELNSLIINSFYNSKNLIIPWTQSKLKNLVEGKESDVIHFFILQLVANLSTHQYYENEDWIPYLKKIKENGNPFTQFLIDKLERYKI
ncbi:MAG: hypothetical protein GF383_04460 [Candidatus Lokiarchaeota archaeon]|nr:hypothetical protein [Candidatus Lokiarchaeota archaeon]